MTLIEKSNLVVSYTKTILNTYTTSDVIALASLIVAVVSIVLTIAIICITNRQNKLSVKPILKIIPFDFEDKIAIYIKNAGIGPLFRNKLEFKNKDATASNLIDLMPSHKTIKWSNFSKFPDFVIPVNEEELLIELNGDPNNDEFNQFKMEVRKALKDITINCDFEDIYKTKFKAEPFKLNNCYGRHFKIY